MEETQRKPKIVVISFHGLGMDNSQDKEIEQALRDKYGDQVVIIKPKYREEGPQFGRWRPDCSRSEVYPIDHSWLPRFFKFCRGYGFPTQSNGVVKEIKDALRQNNIQTDKDSIFIIGISQGGVLAAIVANDYEKELSLKGVITINAPLGGVYCLQNTMDDVNEFLSNGEAGLKEIGFDDEGIEAIKDNSKEELWLSKLAPGVASMLPSSSCIKKVRQFVDSSTISCLLIGSYTERIFSSIKKATYTVKYNSGNEKKVSYCPLSKESPNAEKLHKVFAKLITGSEDGLDDELIPINDQLLIDDVHIKSMPEHTIQQDTKNKNLYRVLLKGPTHAAVIVPIASWPKIEIDTTKTPVIEHDPRVPQHIINFIDKVMVGQKE